ncbi:Ribosomal protein L11 methyltransferase [Lentilactobacillus hilgardii]|uniref:50S ribosomal protein L11 methyltransferase n=1 Tax=Lentilactobacillus hilgardii TaxID=1588 RepID=UPI00019C6559|nr:50S ribosomal protein L11 methyltransferase [Lentilactobacillus hilgardii]EEI18788.1 ribosomal protein L11 methyltransferase [Lentilactobacillus buchneri ATCC 11577]MCT3397601.1 50S ribosomal protein L11 methyltransferase [Lentilactobacillus hilgardii]QIR09382.1 Ribosomal protein L11 methyltransferase [Lentilactobacillus hilgardii]
MQWTEVSIITTSEAVEAVSNILMTYGATGVSIEDAKDFEKLSTGMYGHHGGYIDLEDVPHISKGAIVSAYYPESRHIDQHAAEISSEVQGLTEFGLKSAPGELKISPVADENWKTAWEKYYHPFAVTRYLTVVPSWDDYKPKNSLEQLIRLDPGMAFGTGTHPTTQLSLQALEMVLRGGESIIDVGTGSGVLSIAAKLMGAKKITAYDVDDVAVESAKKNMRLNPQAADIPVAVNDLLKGIHTQVDLVVANILAEIIVPLVPQAYENLKPGGHFLMSGIIKDKYGLIINTLNQFHFKVYQSMKMGDWYAVIAEKTVEEDK